MPTLDFKGKQHIYAHHLTVPYRPLVADAGKSVAPPAGTDAAVAGANANPNAVADDNLIIHGDNLHALKALLPRYAGKVKCIYIDPPYNTGSQAWVFNDNVNSPLMQAWLKSSVDVDDLERHDKWLCMMWPRLHLLRELLADDGAIFVSIDDNEQWRLLGMMEEIFGEGNFVSTIVYVQNLGALPGRYMTQVTEYIHVFAKNIESVSFARLPADEDISDWQQDEIGYYKEGYGLVRAGTSSSREDRPNLFFPIYIGEDFSISLTARSPKDTEILPRHSDGTDAVWRWGRERVESNTQDLIVKPHRRMGYQLITKVRPNIGQTFTAKPRSLWYKPQYAAANGTNIINALMDEQRVFDFPKAVPLLADIIRFANVGPSDIVLDSFAGSGTTAHAVLQLNREDGGNRKFILVECEDYADSITAERVRRVINGVPSARDKVLQEGIGGSFTYCTLGEPIDAEGMLTGEHLPGYTQLAAYLLHIATGVSAGPVDLAPKDADGRFYSDDRADYYLLYQPSLEYLQGDAGMLNEGRARRIGDAARQNGKKAIVFGPGKYIGQRELSAMGIVFCQLPYEMHLAGAGMV